MKSVYKNISIILSAVIFLFASCKKDEVRAVLKQPTAATLASSVSSVVLDSANDAKEAVTFTWPKVDYGYSADVTYTLQFDVASDSFKTATSVIAGINALSKTYTVKDFNVLVFQSLGLAPNTASDVIVRVKSDIIQNGLNPGPSSIPTVYSDTIKLSVTPYKIAVVYPMLWVPGDYQGWNPATAPTIASFISSNIYEGYIYFAPGGTLQFKITPAATWDHSYGLIKSTVNGNNISGTMSLTAGDNLTVPASGYYLLKADLNQTPVAWSATQTTWSIIGDATPGGWDSDTQLTFDAVTKTWSVTVNLVATGKFKFRANDAWDLNLGYDNGSLDYNGSNISVPSGDGKYTITLDLNNPGNYTYSIKKD